MAQITSVSFGRTFNIGNYESVRFEVAVQVDQATNVHAAADLARQAVAAEFAAWQAAHSAAPQEAVPPEPVPPASLKQRAFLDRIAGDLQWSTDQVAEFAASALHADLLTLTKDQASRLIDQLIAIRDGTAPAPDVTASPASSAAGVATIDDVPAAERATNRQIAALVRLQAERDVPAYQGRPFGELSLDAAGTLIAAWQQRPRRASHVADDDLRF